MSHWLMEFEDVCYTYPGTTQPAIANLTLRIPQGKRCAAIGQNGCGKTTLFLLANGLYQPQQGAISYQGQKLKYSRNSLIDLRQQIGLVFQNPEQQLIASTVEEDISYGLCNLGLSDTEISPKVQQVLNQFGLSSFATKPVHQLSLGQKKQVSIAGVMALQPTLLLLDEPTAYLDPLHIRQLATTLNAIHREGTTIFMATHDLEWVYRWADWIFVLNQGTLVLEGTPDNVFARGDLLNQLQLGVPLRFQLSSLLDEVNESTKIEQLKTKILQILDKP